MPKRSERVFVCQSCGHEALRWLGRCPACDAWNTLVEEVRAVRPVGGKAAAQPGSPGWVAASAARSLAQMGEAPVPRRSVGWDEFDRVLGGGLVAGSVILVGGEPGIGKSTLLLQVAERYSRRHGRVLYVSGEESAEQIHLRAVRLGGDHKDVFVACENQVEAIAAAIREQKPALVVIDSVQTLRLEGLESSPGSVAQVRESVTALLHVAKGDQIPMLLVGHVNKQGALAGPKVLEHIVDVVLNFEGDAQMAYRLLRAAKNRYGSTHELGMFEMVGHGLVAVENPSAALLAERLPGAPGSVVVCSIDGNRPLLLEVQALVSPTPFGGQPRRQVTGLDRDRVQIVLAVLEKRCGLKLGTQDVYVSLAGGVRGGEPALDLGVALAVASSYQGAALDAQLVVFGEIGLAGEVRAVPWAERRLVESARLGFTRALVPAGSRRQLAKAPDGIQFEGVTELAPRLKAELRA
ncbi:MAG TPA: DNA repair protein RadA [Limnochordia bacterium]|nr:DNA repair protein RadA [Limnochordia bacterium]